VTHLARRLLVGVLLLCAGGCASSQVGRLRFVNQPPVWRVDDRRPIPRPRSAAYAKMLYFNDAYVLRRLPRALEFRGKRRALGVNALDEVPDSAWFTNRIGVREMSVEEVRRGPITGESPERHRPWVILGTKVGGASVGFIIRDRRGQRFLLKFDEKSNPEMETAADIIVQRILHACGYNVPEDNIVYFREEDLVLSEQATVKDTLGNKRPMTQKDLTASLQRIHVEQDGRIRGMTSRLLAGVPLGGIAMEGTRKDDPNDRIPHEMRRDMRGLSTIFAWLNHTDVKEANSLDIWQPDPANPGRHYVAHYQLDFGMALGGTGYSGKSRQVGFAHAVDIKYLLMTLPTLGFWVRPWEDVEQPAVSAVGLLTARDYRPDLFTPSFPYYPFYEADRFDNFWGAKLLMRFTPEQIRAVVEEAHYSDPRSTEYMVNVLIERQRMTARYWFGQVTPLDRFALQPDRGAEQLCFTDLMLAHGLEDVQRSTRYEAEAYDYHGKATGWRATARPGDGGRACLRGLVLPRRDEGYLIVRIITRRGGKVFAPVDLHLARDPASGGARVIGLRRN
jgi:hypothetical protein